MRVACIVGARPNFMKMAPILRAFDQYPQIDSTLIHTGQHYDAALSDVFFEELEIRPPDTCLNVGSGSHAEQTARLLVELEKTFMQLNAEGGLDRVIVVGDVNSTMAATLAAAKLNIPVAHVEAGLRSFDRTMPEEVNRIVTDSLCDLLLVSEPEGVAHLKKEGHPDENIHLVGNVMIDTLLHQRKKAIQLNTLSDLGISPGSYGVVTLHRPSNVDQKQTLKNLVDVLIEISSQLKIVFPIHPRTRNKLNEFGMMNVLEDAADVVTLDPLGYLDFLCLTSQAKVIITDSGGLQEESTALQIPCLTMRENTERPITVSEGTSVLIGHDASYLQSCLHDVINGNYKEGKCPELWDGKASERIAKIVSSVC